MNNAKLAIIIPAFNGDPQIKQCLQSLKTSTYGNVWIILVDHGPTDHISRWIRKEFSHVTCLRGSPELWWSGATNLGIQYALSNGCSLVMLLNHDCYVKTDTIEVLMRQHSEFPDSILAPEQFDYLSRTLKCSTAYTAYFAGFPTVIPPIRTGHSHGNNALIQTSMIVGGRGVIIPTAVFKNIGLLDEKGLPHYGSDNDFYMRCKSAGYRLYVSTKAKVLIDNRQTTLASGIGSLTLKKFMSTLNDRRSHRNIKDQIQLFRKHYPVPGLYPIGVAMNLLRYFCIYLVLRSRYLLVNFFRQNN